MAVKMFRRAGVAGLAVLALGAGSGLALAGAGEVHKPEVEKPAVEKPSVQKPRLSKAEVQNETTPAARPHARARNPIVLSDILPPDANCDRDGDAAQGQGDCKASDAPKSGSDEPRR